MVADQIAARGPRCWSTGRCCNFAEWGHRLYVTGLEAAYAVTRLPPGMPLDQSSLSAAESRGDCPFLQMKLCGIHTIKPMGCRVYFCDRDVQEWQHGVSERAVDMIRRIHDELDLQYRYGEWRAILGRFVHLTPE